MSADITEMTRRARRRPFQLRFETCDEAFICNIKINVLLNETLKTMTQVLKTEKR